VTPATVGRHFDCTEATSQVEHTCEMPVLARGGINMLYRLNAAPSHAGTPHLDPRPELSTLVRNSCRTPFDHRRTFEVLTTANPAAALPVEVTDQIAGPTRPRTHFDVYL